MEESCFSFSFRKAVPLYPPPGNRKVLHLHLHFGDAGKVLPSNLLAWQQEASSVLRQQLRGRSQLFNAIFSSLALPASDSPECTLVDSGVHWCTLANSGALHRTQ